MFVDNLLMHSHAKTPTRSDPHFWMPLALPQDEYILLMSQKGVEDDKSCSDHTHMTKMKDTFLAANSELRLFGTVDVGSNAC